MRTENKTMSLIYGPPSPDMVLPFKFHPGKNKVPDEYWDFLIGHRNFKRDVLDPKSVVSCESRPVSAYTPGEIWDQLAKLADLSKFGADDAKQAIELVDDKDVLDRWWQAEHRTDVKSMILVRIRQLS